MKSFALRFQENYYVCIPYKFLEVAGYSDIHNGFISFSRISYSYLNYHGSLRLQPSVKHSVKKLNI